MITVYSKDNCTFCTRAKNLLNAHNIKFEEFKLDRDFTREEFIQLFPQVKTFPYIINNGNEVGGYSRLVEVIAANPNFGTSLILG